VIGKSKISPITYHPSLSYGTGEKSVKPDDKKERGRSGEQSLRQEERRRSGVG
jgi:hypothetical protein